MGSLILTRDDREQEDDGFRHRQSFDDNVNRIPTLQPPPPSLVNFFSEIDPEMTYPTGLPSVDRPNWFPTRSFAISTSVFSAASPFPEQAQVTSVSSLTLIKPALETPLSTSSNEQEPGNGNAPNWDEDPGPNNKVMPAVVGTVVVVVVAIIGVLAFFYIRKWKRRQAQLLAGETHMQEMKAGEQPAMLAGRRTLFTYPQYAAPPSQPPPTSLATPPPVILGPIIPGSNGAYYTGIDTSDVVSMHEPPVVDRTGLGNPFADGGSLNEEPPPPYRPRSLDPMSRNASLRAPPAETSRTHLIGGYDQTLSPFADPRDDDVISDVSGPAVGSDHADMSVVSDMSYQEDPVVIRRAV